MYQKVTWMNSQVLQSFKVGKKSVWGILSKASGSSVGIGRSMLIHHQTFGGNCLLIYSCTLYCTVCSRRSMFSFTSVSYSFSYFSVYLLWDTFKFILIEWLFGSTWPIQVDIFHLEKRGSFPRQIVHGFLCLSSLHLVAQLFLV